MVRQAIWSGMAVIIAGTLCYKVGETKIEKGEDTVIFNGTRPSLLVVRFDQQASDRLVILCSR